MSAAYAVIMAGGKGERFGPEYTGATTVTRLSG